MADETLQEQREPLLADQEGFGGYPADESVLQALAALDAAEAAGCGGGSGVGGATPLDHGPVEDQDVYKMKELIREKPTDVLQYLETEGVVKLGEFDVQDALAFRAFGKENILTLGADHFEVDWEAMWTERLADFGRQREVQSALGWSTKVTLEAHVVNLRDAAAAGSRGLLHPLLKRFHAHACSSTVFALPAVQAVILYKWTQWARTFLLYELACYCCWLAVFTAFTLLFQGEDWSLTLWQTLQDRVGFWCIVFSVLSLLPMAPFVWMDLCTIAVYKSGWLQPWNVLDMASYILQVVVCILHLQRTFVDEGWFSVLVATQQVLLWIKLHYFARAFNPTKNTIIDTIRVVMEDMKWFLLFLCLTMAGFGLAFYALFRQDRHLPDFANLWHAFASMFSYLLGMFDYNVFYGSTNPTAAMLLFIGFEFLMNILLLNVLIASMTSSFSKITQDEGLRLLHSKAEIIDELEATLPAWVLSGAAAPAFIHILKIHPNAQYEVNLNSVESNLLGAQHETRLRVEELEERLAKLQKKLDVLIKLHISSLGPSHALMLSRQASQAPYGSSSMHGATASPMWQGRASAAAGLAAAAAMPSLSLGAAAASAAASAGHPASAAAAAAAGGGPVLRHMLSALPEQLAGVSGPLVAAAPLPVGVGAAAAATAAAAGLRPQHHAAAAQLPILTGPGTNSRGLARRSGPPALWQAGAAGSAGPGSSGGSSSSVHAQEGTGDAVLTVGRAGSGPAGAGLAAAGPWELRAGSGSSSGSGLRHSMGLGRVRRAQLLTHGAAGHAGGTATVPAQLARARALQQQQQQQQQLFTGCSSLERAHSV